MLVSTLLAVCLPVLVHGKPLARSLQVHEAIKAAPPAFQVVGPAASDATLDLRIALVQGDMAGLEKALMDVSTPSSAQYGQHLSKEEVRSASVLDRVWPIA